MYMYNDYEMYIFTHSTHILITILI